MSLEIDKLLIERLFEQAKESPRLRMNYDLRTSSADTSQRMLNVLLPGTEVPIHRHEETAETVVCLCGRLEEMIYEEIPDGTFQEVSRLCCALLRENMGYRFRLVLGIPSGY